MIVFAIIRTFHSRPYVCFFRLNFPHQKRKHACKGVVFGSSDAGAHIMFLSLTAIRLTRSATMRMITKSTMKIQVFRSYSMPLSARALEKNGMQASGNPAMINFLIKIMSPFTKI